MAEPVVENFTYETPGVGGSSITLVKPSGVVVGELLQIIVINEDADGGTSWSDLTGWDKKFEIGGATPDATGAVYHRIADGTEPASETINYNGPDYTCGWYMRISGADTTAPLAAVGTEYSTSSTNSWTTSGVAFTAPNGALAFTMAAFDGGDGYPFSSGGTGWPTTIPANQALQDGTGGANSSGFWVTQGYAGSGTTDDFIGGSAVTDGVASVQFVIAGAASGGTTLTRSLSDNVAVSDSLGAQRANTRALADGVSYLADGFARFLETYRSLSEGSLVYDELHGSRTVARALEDSAQLFDAMLLVRSIRRVLEDSTGVGDAMLRAFSGVVARVLSDDILVADQLQRTVGRLRTLSDSALVFDTSTRLLELTRSLAETVLVYDVLQSAKAGSLQRVLSDAVAVYDSVLRSAAVARVLGDAAPVYESLLSAVVAGGVTIIERQLADSVVVSDTAQRVVHAVRLFADNAPVFDNSARTVESVRVFYDQVLAVGEELRTAAERYRTLGEAVPVTDYVVRIQRLTRALVDDVLTYDSLSVAYNILFQAQIFILAAVQRDTVEISIRDDVRVAIEDDNQPEGL